MNYTRTPGGQGNPDPIADLEARLAEIEAGILDPLSFTSRTLIQATFPHSALAGDKIVLVNGHTTVTMMGAYGLPYGMWPRLLMCWLTREALRRKDLPIDEAREIPLSGSLSAFMREVGVKSTTGGKRGSITMLKLQMKALFSTTITVDREDEQSAPDDEHLDLKNSLISERTKVWWTAKREDDIEFEGFIRLSKDFFLDLVSSAVPIDTRIIRNLRRSPMAMDVYCWLTYRLFYLRSITVISWDQIRGQLGASYEDTPQGRRNFKKKFLAALDRVLDEWPTKSVVITGNGIMLKPGPPSVPRKVQQEFSKFFHDDEPAPF